MSLKESYKLNARSNKMAIGVHNVKTASGLELQRSFIYLLLFISFLALLPRVVLGATQFINYDGYWHLFIATQDSWRMLVSEWKGAAHPPLYFLLLRGCA